jgi:nucleoid DNA-binding protein
MKYKELIDSTSTEFQLPATKAKKIATHIFTQIANSIRNGDNVVTPLFNILSRDVPERDVVSEVTGEIRKISAHKRGILKLKSSNNQAEPPQDSI